MAEELKEQPLSNEPVGNNEQSVSTELVVDKEQVAPVELIENTDVQETSIETKEEKLKAKEDLKYITQCEYKMPLKKRILANVFSRKFLIITISTIIIFLEYFTNLIKGAFIGNGNEWYYAALLIAFISAKTIESGNYRDDLELIKRIPIGDFIKYKLKVIFDADFIAYVFSMTLFVLGAIDASLYFAVSTIYMGTNSISKLSETVSDMKNSPIIGSILGRSPQAVNTNPVTAEDIEDDRGM